MAKIYFRKKVLYAKVETAYGTPATPIGSNAVRTKDLSISPLEGDELKPGYDKPTFGNDPSAMVGVHVVVTFKVPFSGSGTPGIPPNWGVPMIGCGHEETVTATTKVVYSPIDDDPSSITLRFERDKVLHTVTGCRGSVKLTTDKRNYPWLEYTFMGLYVPPVANTTPLVPTFTGFAKPVPFRASTVDCTLIGQVVGLHTMSIDFGQKVEFYEHSEEESIQITGREASFNATFEEPEITAHDFFADIIGETAGPLIYKHGVAAGNIVTVSAPQTQIVKPTPTDVQGVSALQVTGPFATDGSAPDYTITCT